MSQSEYWGYNASSWKLKAKLNAGDEWTVIDEQTDNTDWLNKQEYDYTKAEMSVTVTALFNLKKKNQPYQYFRLEISKKGHSNRVLDVKFKPLF
jgi:hypothetical protein